MKGGGMLIRRRFAIPALLAVAIVLCLFLGSCRTTKVSEPVPEANPIESNLAVINQAAYPEGSYTVVEGDTPRGIAAKLHVDYRLFAGANGLTEGSVLTPGYVLAVPKVSSRSDSFAGEKTADGPIGLGEKSTVAKPAASAAKPAAAPSGATTVAWSGENPVNIGSDGVVKAVSAGKVMEVHRAYPTLGDVVIIEDEVKGQRAVYAGTFTPIVSQGASVTVGQPIGEQAKAGGVKVTKFMKLQR
jgi:hypothetical protein